MSWSSVICAVAEPKTKVLAQKNWHGCNSPMFHRVLELMMKSWSVGVGEQHGTHYSAQDYAEGLRVARSAVLTIHKLSEQLRDTEVANEITQNISTS